MCVFRSSSSEVCLNGAAANKLSSAAAVAGACFTTWISLHVEGGIITSLRGENTATAI
jgi:hypothetical protein